jgi:dTDP-4-dehydrorhamnose 3,5-epimerase
MKFTKTSIEGLVIIEPRVFGDERGYFLESYNEKEFEQAICKVSFVQDNESKSSKGVLRGLHYQKPPFNQAKLVRCIAGRVLDVAVDIRKGSPTYGKHVSIELSGENKKQVYVPRGFAHGFSVLSKTAVITYKVDSMYAPEFDSGIRYDDTELGIDWGLPQEEIQLSEKDKDLPSFKDLDSPFKF